MASLKERKTLTLRGFRGIDYGSSPLEVSSARAVDARNMILENGVLQKRPGWRMVQDLSSWGAQTESHTIHGFRYWTDQEAMIGGWVVHMGTILFFDIRLGKGKEMYIENVLDEPSTWIEQNGRFYIICGDIYVFPVWEKGAPTFKKLTELEDLYIPTTTVSINPEGEADTAIDVLESPNLLTSWRKNTLVARKADCPICSEGIYLFNYNLDAAVNAKTNITILCRGVQYISVDHYLYGDLKVIVRKDLYDGLSQQEKEGPLYSTDCYRGELFCKNSNTGHGRITMRFENDDCDHNGSASAVVTFCVDYTDEEVKERKRRITGCRVGTLFGVNGDTNRLFLSGNPDAPGRIFFSDYQNFNYFPENGYVTAGSERSDVKGFLRLSDNTMAVLKKPSAEDFSLFYLTGGYEEKYDSNGEAILGPARFYVANGGTDAACVDGRSALNLFGDALMLSGNGVVAVIPPSQTTVHRSVKERGYSLGNGKIKNMSGGHAVIYRGRYYLAVDDGEGSVLVADPKYKYTRQGNDLDQSFNYEWWHWDHIPATAWYAFKGGILDQEGYFSNMVIPLDSFYGEGKDETLLFGTNDGKICAFGTSIKCVQIGNENSLKLLWGDTVTAAPNSEGERYVKTGALSFYDQTYIRVSNGELTVTDERDGITVSEALWSRIKTGDRIVIGKLEEKILVDDNETDHSGEPLFVVKKENKIIELREEEQGAAIRWKSETALQSTSGTVFQHTPIRARWFTPYFDLGSNLYAKTLLGLSLTAGSESQGLRFGYETKRGDGMTENRLCTSEDGMSFAYDFRPISWTDRETPAAHTVRCNVRNFNYIRFGFVSDVPKPCSIHALGVYYKINQMNRWIR